MAAQTPAPAIDNKRAELKYIRLENIQLNDKTVAVRGVKTDSEKFKDLLHSIRTRGLQNPISVRVLKDPTTGEPTGFYGMVDGLHRYTAHQILKKAEIACAVRDVRDDEIIEEQLVGNLQRIEMRPAEYSNALMRHMMSHPGQSLDEIAARVGKSRAWLDQRLSITKLPTVDKEDIDEQTGEPRQPYGGVDVQELVNTGEIIPANAYQLAKLVMDPPVPVEFWNLMLGKAKTMKSTEFAGLVQLRLTDIKKARATGGKLQHNENERIPSLRGKAEIQTHLERIKLQVEKDKADAEAAKKQYTVPEFTRGVISALEFSLQIDDKSWERRKAEEAKKEAEKEAKRQERLAGSVGESLSLGGLIPDSEEGAKAALKAASEIPFDPEAFKVTEDEEEKLEPETAEEALSGDE